MNNINEALRAMKTLVEVAEMAKERNELREELNALRKEVEELKEKRLNDKRQEAIDKAQAMIKETVDFFNKLKGKPMPKEPVLDWMKKNLKEEKPKEPPEQKGMLKLNWNHCGLELKPKMDYVDLTIKDGRDIVSIPLDKSHVEKLVDYLKKHFDI